MTPKIYEQIERARFIVEDSYSKAFEDDGYALEFLLDRLERVEKIMTDTYDAMDAIRQAL